MHTHTSHTRACHTQHTPQRHTYTTHSTCTHTHTYITHTTDIQHSHTYTKNIYHTHTSNCTYYYKLGSVEWLDSHLELQGFNSECPAQPSGEMLEPTLATLCPGKGDSRYGQLGNQAGNSGQSSIQLPPFQKTRTVARDTLCQLKYLLLLRGPRFDS